MNEDTAARVARTVAAIRSGVYVSRQTMQELLADIHDQQPAAKPPTEEEAT